MPRRQNEPISVKPVRVLGVVLEEFRPKRVRHRRRTKRQSRVTAVRPLNGID